MDIPESYRPVAMENGTRYLFEKVQYTRYEYECLDRLNSPKQIHHGDDLRYLYASKFKISDAIERLGAFTRWYESMNINPKNIMATISVSTLEEGSIYIRGRDINYRPILFVDLGKIDLQERLVDEYIELGIRIMEYTIKHILVPGKVEQWVILLDMNTQWFSDLSLTNIEKILSTFLNNFPCRLHKLYIYNPPVAFKKLWQLFQSYLPNDVIQKIVLEDDKLIPKKLLREVACSQLSVRYGGAMESRANFWPPLFPIGDVTTPILMSDNIEDMSAILSKRSMMSERFSVDAEFCGIDRRSSRLTDNEPSFEISIAKDTPGYNDFDLDPEQDPQNLLPGELDCGLHPVVELQEESRAKHDPAISEKKFRIEGEEPWGGRYNCGA